jgi:hypothetical protein
VNASIVIRLARRLDGYVVRAGGARGGSREVDRWVDWGGEVTGGQRRARNSNLWRVVS